MAQVFNYDFAALVLVDALHLGDAKAAALHEISVRTIKRYRLRMKTDAKLAQAVTKLRQQIFVPAKPKISGAIDAAIAFLEDAPKHLDAGNIEHVMVVAQTFKTLSEIRLAERMIAGRLKGAGELVEDDPALVDGDTIDVESYNA
ncbi:MAG: hypothetical protein WCD18_18415 [Thermosynechococcaceae cyanobacterium]